jgi:hypothetical protein
MNQEQQRHPTGSFEDRLLDQLRAVVAERAAAAEPEASTATAAWRRGPRLAIAGAAVTAMATAVLIVTAGGSDTPAAYAVEPLPEGMISVEIRSLEDAKGLEEALGEAGVPASVNYLAAGMACQEPRFQPAFRGEGEGTRARGKMTTSSIGRSRDGATVFSISRDTVGPGQTLVVTASPGPGGTGSAVAMAVAEGKVAPCAPVQAPAGGG